MARRYTKEMHDWLAEHIPLQSCAATADDFERVFGVPMTNQIIKGYAHNHKIRTKSGNEHLTPEQARWIVENGAGRNNEDLTALFNATFGTSLSVSQINCRRYRLGAVSGLTPHPPNSGQFQKGHIPYQKGRKRTEWASPEAIAIMEQHQFKKGDPRSVAAVGTERMRADGLYIKVAQPNVWRQKHRVVWEQAHGAIPKGHAVIFLDGNTLNCAADNLALVDLATNARLNQMHLRFDDAQLTQTGVAIAKVATAMGKRKKR